MKGGLILGKRIMIRGKIIDATISIPSTVSNYVSIQEELKNSQKLFQKITSIIEYNYRCYFSEPASYDTDTPTVTYSFINDDTALIAISHCICEIRYTNQQSW